LSLARLAILPATAIALVTALTGCSQEPDATPEVEFKPTEAGAPDSAPGARLALWVPAEGSARVLEHPERLDELFETAHALGATDLFVQVFRGGRAWFDSSVADASPYQVVRARTGVDPLALLLTRAGESGIRVHAWINVLSLSTRRDAALLNRLGPDAIAVDRLGRSVLDYPDLEIPTPERRWLRMGTRQVWLDPGAPAVADTLEAVVEELFRRYPALAGLHLDYVRYPDVLPFSPGARFGVGLDFGYGEATRRRFQRETGLRAPFRDSLANANRWDDWRRERVTEIVRRLGDAARAGRPEAERSAAVWAYANRAYLSLFQDWRGWLDAGWIDFAVPMTYTVDDRLLRYLGHELTGGLAGDRVWLGLGSWLFARNPARARAQLEFAQSLEPSGVALFSYDALRDTPALQEVLAPPAGTPTPPGEPGARAAQ